MESVLSIKLSHSEKERLRIVAERRKVSMSALLRQGLDKVLEEPEAGGGLSCYQKTASFFENPGHIGSSGVGDLSSNKRHLNGFGR